MPLLNDAAITSLHATFRPYLLEGKISKQQITELFEILSSSEETIKNILSINIFHGRVSKEEISELFSKLEYQTEISVPSLLDYAIVILYLGLLTFEEVLQIVSGSSGAPQFCANGVMALLEGLISFEQMTRITTCSITCVSTTLISGQGLAGLFSDGGLQALREKLITPEQAREIFHRGRVGYCHNIAPLFTPNGLQALREQLITPQQVIRIQNLRELLSDNGLECLRRGLISVETASNLKTHPIEFSNTLLTLLKEANRIRSQRQCYASFFVLVQDDQPDSGKPKYPQVGKLHALPNELLIKILGYEGVAPDVVEARPIDRYHLKP